MFNKLRSGGAITAVVALVLLFILGMATPYWEALTIGGIVSILFIAGFSSIVYSSITKKKDKLLSYTSLIIIILVIAEFVRPLVNYIVGMIF